MIDKKTLIYNAVLEIIKEQGFSSKIKISDIAKKASIGKGTVYEYFDNKDEILTGAIISLIERTMKEMLYDSNDNNGEFKTLLINLINRTLKLFKRNHSFQSLFISQNIGGTLSLEMKMKIMCKMEENKLQYDKVFRDIVKKGIEEGILKEDTEDFNIIAAKSIIISSMIEYIPKDKIKNDNEEKEFINRLYNLIIKILS